ncbi:MAG: hypothetical protein E7168_05705 [Firmicutes bacterium]|nr:hypothetical protein [Bacillota bacterium]
MKKQNNNDNCIKRIRDLDKTLFDLYVSLYDTILVCGKDSLEYQSILENIKLVKSVESKIYKDFLEDKEGYRKAFLEYFKKIENLSFGAALDDGVESCIDLRIFYSLYGHGFCRFNYLFDTYKRTNRMFDTQSQFIRQAYYCEDSFWFYYFMENEIKNMKNEYVSGELLKDLVFSCFVHPDLEKRVLLNPDGKKEYPLPYQTIIEGLSPTAAISFLHEYSSDMFQNILDTLSYFSMILERDDLEIEDREYLMAYNRCILFSDMMLVPDQVYTPCILKLLNIICETYSSRDYLEEMIELLNSMQNERENAKQLVSESKVKTIR